MTSKAISLATPKGRKKIDVLPIHCSRPSIMKHSSFSSLTTSSRNDIALTLRRLSSLPADLCCSICMNIFEKPSMLTCGHSFCAECIKHWLSENISCPTCRTDTHVPIRNIALEQVVEEFRLSQKFRGRYSKQHSVSEQSGPDIHNGVSRQQIGGRRRARFSIIGPEIIVDGPGSSLEALPASSRENSYRSLGSLPRLNLDVSEDGFKDDAKLPTGPRRRLFDEGRRICAVERHAELSSMTDYENDDLAQMSSFKRASLFRRSICALRRSVSRRNRRRGIQGSLENTDFVDEGHRSSPVDEVFTDSALATQDTVKTKKFKWRRLFPFRLKKVHPTRSKDKNEEISYGPLCVYSGFGRSFERIHPGEEVAIAVFGRRGVGKTSLLDIATLSCEDRQGIAPLGLTERMRLGGKNNHSEYRFANMTSFTVQAHSQVFVIDLIDAEFEDDHSIAHASYMRAADAAILLYSCSDSASLLTAMSIHRHLAAISETRKPCVLLANVIDGIAQRYVTPEMGERTARNIRATYMETNLLLQDGNVFKALERLCHAVIMNRKDVDANDMCAVM